MKILFKCHIGIGTKVQGEVLSANDNFSARYDLDRLTMASNSSQVLLFVGLLVHDEDHINGNVIYQYASTSAGMKFDLIAQTSETTGNIFYHPDIVQYNDSFII